VQSTTIVLPNGQEVTIKEPAPAIEAVVKQVAPTFDLDVERNSKGVTFKLGINGARSIDEMEALLVVAMGAINRRLGIEQG
jgi:hypothetical protein